MAWEGVVLLCYTATCSAVPPVTTVLNLAEWEITRGAVLRERRERQTGMVTSTS